MPGVPPHTPLSSSLTPFLKPSDRESGSWTGQGKLFAQSLKKKPNNYFLHDSSLNNNTIRNKTKTPIPFPVKALAMISLGTAALGRRFCILEPLSQAPLETCGEQQILVGCLPAAGEPRCKPALAPSVQQRLACCLVSAMHWDEAIYTSALWKAGIGAYGLGELLHTPDFPLVLTHAGRVSAVPRVGSSPAPSLLSRGCRLSFDLQLLVCGRENN